MTFERHLGTRFQDYVLSEDSFRFGGIPDGFIKEVFGENTLAMDYSEGYRAASKNTRKYIFEKTVELVDFINSKEAEKIPENKYIKSRFELKKPEVSDIGGEEYMDYVNRVYGFITIICECILPRKIFADNEEIYEQAKNIWQAELMRQYLAHLM